MRPIFTIHAGEYLVAQHIEDLFANKYGIRVWVPSKDDGVDLLLTSKNRKKTLGVQVKFSKDYALLEKDPIYEALVKGWFRINWRKLNQSKADIWVFVIPRYTDNRCVMKIYYLVFKKEELIKRIKGDASRAEYPYFKNESENISVTLYPQVFAGDICVDVRNALHGRDNVKLKQLGDLKRRKRHARNFSQFLGEKGFEKALKGIIK